MLSRDEAKAFYDRFGAKQDSQGFYEDRALEDLVSTRTSTRQRQHMSSAAAQDALRRDCWNIICR